ncbi:MAG: divergent polysaccharide deacetylase family protein [Pseudomonadota bacterium]
MQIKKWLNRVALCICYGALLAVIGWIGYQFITSGDQNQPSYSEESGGLAQSSDSLSEASEQIEAALIDRLSDDIKIEDDQNSNDQNSSAQSSDSIEVPQPLDPSNDVIEESELSVILLPHPDPGLVEANDEYGLLPRIGADGRKPWQAYKRPPPNIKTPYGISVIIADAGLNERLLDGLFKFPPAMNLAFSPYSSDLEGKVSRAREIGYESLLMLPLEPKDYPFDDPGPLTLRLSNKVERNIDLLYHILGSTGGYVGLITLRGSAFVEHHDHTLSLLDQLNSRGLFFIDASDNLNSNAFEILHEYGFEGAIPHRVIRNPMSAEELVNELLSVEQIAYKHGHGLLVIKPYPAMIEVLYRWIQTLQVREITLLPVSAFFEDKR